jgi:hypothetical protein
MRESQYRAARRLAERVTEFCYRRTYHGRGRHYPPIVVNALPKSGSTYITRTLQQTLKVGPRRFALHGFHSAGTVDVNSLDRVAEGNCVCHQHLPPEPHIVAALKAKLGRMVLNIRDPRAALVSWTHFVNEFHAEHSYLQALQEAETVLPESYFQLPIAEQLSWQIDHRLPHMIDWIAKWLEIADRQDPDFPILVTDYAEMVRDTRAFVQRILDFYGVAIEADWLAVRKPKPGQWKFRVGTGKDWRTDFTPAALERATAALPADWMSRFGWS